MEKLVADTIEDMHSIIVHFPISLLVLVAALTVYVQFRRNDGLTLTSWILLSLGTLGAIAASITGLISHFPYEETELHGVIETHQWWSFGVTALFIGLTVWRWMSRRNGRDAGESLPFLGVTLLGTVGLVISGMTGGDLVFDYGINVRGINPLLGQ